MVTNTMSCLKHLGCWPEDSYMSCAGGIIGCQIEPNGDLFHCGRIRIERPEQNAISAGAERAFLSLPAMGCAQCWCASRVELNLLNQLSPEVLLDLII